MATFQKTSESTYIILDIRDNTLGDIDKLCHLGNQCQLGTPRFGLGALDRLPLEIINLTLIRLDIQSLTDFRRVNKRAKLVTDSLPQYKLILAHAPASIRGSLNIGTARFFSCQDLYEKLSTAECDSCGDFGAYLYLVTCRRICYLCFTEKIDYLPLPRKDAVRKFGLCSKQLESLPCLKSFPGHYSPRGTKCRRRERLFDYSVARQTGIALHGSITSMEKYASETALSLRRARGTNLRRPRSEDLIDGIFTNPRRFMGIIRAPFFNIQTASPEWGFYCVGCKGHYCRPLYWCREYTLSTFKDHIRECGEIKEGKHTPRANISFESSSILSIFSI